MSRRLQSGEVVVLAEDKVEGGIVVAAVLAEAGAGAVDSPMLRMTRKSEAVRIDIGVLGKQEE
jgi:hypothetical protein